MNLEIKQIIAEFRKKRLYQHHIALPLSPVQYAQHLTQTKKPFFQRKFYIHCVWSYTLGLTP